MTKATKRMFNLKPGTTIYRHDGTYTIVAPYNECRGAYEVCEHLYNDEGEYFGLSVETSYFTPSDIIGAEVDEPMLF